VPSQDQEQDKNSLKGEAANDREAAAAPQAEVEADANASANTGLTSEVQKVLAEKQELMNTLVRRQADFENYRKRIEKERHADRHRGVEVFVEQLLPVLDAFDLALSADNGGAEGEYLKGFELIRRQLWDVISKQGVKRIEAVGKEFDPHLHHAIDRVETNEHPEGTIVAEHQPGYMFHDRVLRPAMVRVAAEHAKPAHKR
jgi:molecular chaperone GrpE